MAAGRFNIGVDVDGVLANFTGGAREICKRLYGKPDDSLIQTSWDFSSLGLTKEDEIGMYKEIDRTWNWWMSLKPMLNVTLLPFLVRNHRVVFVTNRKDGFGDPIEEQTARWLYNTFYIENPNVVISGDKGAVAKGLALDYLIDDRPKNIEDVVRDYPRCRAVLYSDTFNQDFDYKVRVKSFDQFARYVHEKAVVGEIYQEERHGGVCC